MFPFHDADALLLPVRSKFCDQAFPPIQTSVTPSTAVIAPGKVAAVGTRCRSSRSVHLAALSTDVRDTVRDRRQCMPTNGCQQVSCSTDTMSQRVTTPAGSIRRTCAKYEPGCLLSHDPTLTQRAVTATLNRAPLGTAGLCQRCVLWLASRNSCTRYTRQSAVLVVSSPE